MVVTDDAALARRARHLKDMAHRPGDRFRHDELGYNYRMTSLQAAFGIGQLEHVAAFLAQRQWMAAEYAARLGDVAGLRLPGTKPWAQNVHWMYAVYVDDAFALSRDQLRAQLAAAGVDTRSFFPSSAGQPMVRERAGIQGPFPVSERIAQRGLCLPSGLALTLAQIDYVCDAILAAGRSGARL